MMKQVKFRMPRRMLTLTGGLLLAASSWAQSGAIKGQVKDATGEPVMGATITANGKAVGITDMDGNYSVNVAPGTKLTFTYLGMTPQTVTAGDNMVITMKNDEKTLNDVVVIGYGVAKKNDLTGSVVAINPDSKNKGLTVSAQDMLQGKVAGVNITNSGGTPGGGATIRIRGGSSLSASNDPLIVIDGVIMDNNGIQGLSNPLSMVNPQDIESFSVLKDASATAIYGSRGSNGVIIITTKKGHKGQKPSVSYAGSFTVSTKKKTIDVLSGDEFRNFVTTQFGANSDEAALLGTANTDWQDEIYRTAYSHDHNVTVSGSTSLGADGSNYLPYRVSAGFTDQQGIVKTSDFKRITTALNLSPHFFDDHLTFNINAKGMWTKNRYADGGAIGAALYMDPTQPVYSDDPHYGGYWEWTKATDLYNTIDPSYTTTQNTQATSNPVAILNLKNDRAISRDLMLSGEVDYKIHGFEDLHLHATGSLELSAGKQTTSVDPRSPQAYFYGSYGWTRGTKRNMQGNVYALYTHDFNDKYKNHFDIMGGVEESRYWRHYTDQYVSYDDAMAGTFQKVHETSYSSSYGPNFKSEYRLVSYFGRANWSLMDGRYMLTASFRADGSSRFKDRWGYFPAFAFAWRMKDENFFKNINWLSDLKMRLSYGKTGQQEIGQGDYPYVANYTMNSSSPGSYYPVYGDGTMARPNAYNTDITWEKTTTYNIGFDFGILNQRLTGSFDWYYRKTNDLINTVVIPMGTNFSNRVVSNIGDLKNTGVEFSLDWRAIRTKDFLWRLGYNMSYNVNKITKLTGGSSDDYFVATGDIHKGTGVMGQAQKVGYAANSFYVYQQVYDANGKPIEGVVVDRNGDGKITEADRYIYKHPAPTVTMGLSSKFEYKNWDLGFNLRANLGNYVFNAVQDGSYNTSSTAVYPQSSSLSNRTVESLKYMWQKDSNVNSQSDRWVQNASFLKMDNVTLGYSFENLFKGTTWHGLSGRAYVTANNVFTITNYDGIDPEVDGGIDYQVYPRPFSVIVGLNLNF
jgi:TonB-linked SusC/RagA family outer membrane protein